MNQPATVRTHRLDLRNMNSSTLAINGRDEHETRHLRLKRNNTRDKSAYAQGSIDQMRRIQHLRSADEVSKRRRCGGCRDTKIGPITRNYILRATTEMRAYGVFRKSGRSDNLSHVMKPRPVQRVKRTKLHITSVIAMTAETAAMANRLREFRPPPPCRATLLGSHLRAAPGGIAPCAVMKTIKDRVPRYRL
jgi:hypothetical protein